MKNTKTKSKLRISRIAIENLSLVTGGGGALVGSYRTCQSDQTLDASNCATCVTCAVGAPVAPDDPTA